MFEHVVNCYYSYSHPNCQRFHVNLFMFLLFFCVFLLFYVNDCIRIVHIIVEGVFKLKSIRQQEILKLVNANEFVTIKELAMNLEVSEMTVRRDINELDSNDKLIKEHGGARKKQTILTTSQKINKHVVEKEYIGILMNNIISPDDVVYIAAGTTSFHAIKNIADKYKYIITNSLFTFNWLAENNYAHIFLSGGEFFKRTGEFYGAHAESILDNFNIDVAFLSTNGINNNDVTTSSPTLGTFQNKVISKAKKIYIIADSSKFGVSDSYTFTTLDKVDGIITDQNLAKEKLEYYNKITNVINK